MRSVTDDEIKCPHCGYEFSDNYEKDDEGVLECPHCDKPFWYTRNVVITYSMTPLEKEECPKCGKHDVLNNYVSSIGTIAERLCESCLGVAVHKLQKQYIASLHE